MTARLVHLVLAAGIVFGAGADWRHFRGTDNTSVSTDRELAKNLGLPERFGPESVAWKAPLPGTGPSCPIVVSGRVFVTAATGPKQDRLHLLAFDAASGRPLWERQLWATGHTVCNSYGGVAAPTPASDGQRVFAFYSSNDLACFDLDGNLQWFRGLAFESAATRNDSGMASSPLCVGQTVVVQMENQGESFAAGIDALSGETLWRIPREAVACWTSPTLLRGSKPEEDLVLLQSRSCLTVHEPRTGREVAKFAADCSTLSSPTTANGVLFAAAAGGITALKYDPQEKRLATLWQNRQLQIANVSPVVHAGRLYAMKSPAILVAADAANGKLLAQLRLKGTTWATPVVVGNTMFVVNHDGLLQVVDVSGEAKLIGSLQVDSGILATPVVADGALYLRSNSTLWKLGRK
jgi:outer membrane protein assembly factor BamB